MIRFEHVTKRYEDKDALSDLNLEIRDGEIFGLIGHNGAGKTTTISILTSIIEASYGEFTLMIWPSANIVMPSRKNRLCARFTGPIPKFDCQ